MGWLGDAIDTVTGAKGVEKAADKAAEQQQRALDQSIARGDEAMGDATELLSPYIDREYTASNQMQAQMGLAPSGGHPGLASLSGNQPPPPESFPRTGEADERQVREAFRSYGMREPTPQEIEYYTDKGRATELYTDVVEPGPRQIKSAYYGGGAEGIKEFEGEFIEQPGGDEFGTVNIDMENAQTMGAGGGPQAQTIDDIMARAGADRMPPELRAKYIEDLMGDPRTDPELAGYLGLTPESLNVGSDYQNNPAYAAAREAGMDTVNAGAAGAGTLYSGARGEALRDVGQGVEQDYYFDAMNRRRDMMGARRAQFGADRSARGGAYESDQSRGQSYFNNYMTMLSDMANPVSTTNLANAGTNLAANQGSDMMTTARNTGDLMTSGASAVQAGRGDLLGAGVKLGTAFI